MNDGLKFTSPSARRRIPDWAPAKDPNGMKPACQTILLSPPSTPFHTSSHRTYDNMSLQQSFSGLRKNVKDKLSKIGDKMGKEQPDVVGEGFEHPSLSLQSEPAIVMGGRARRYRSWCRKRRSATGKYSARFRVSGGNRIRPGKPGKERR